MFKISRSSLIAMSVLSLAAVSQAAEVTVGGSTLGGWNGGSLGSSASLLGLTFSNSIFSGTTSGGFLAFGGNPSPGSNVDNFGSFSLSSAANTYTGNTFTLGINFTSPTGITGSPNATFVANIQGQVTNSTSGGVNIDFSSATPQVFTFNDGSFVGSFTVRLNSVAINPGNTASLTGVITGTATPVPEPASLTVLGLAGIALIRRRRKA